MKTAAHTQATVPKLARQVGCRCVAESAHYSFLITVHPPTKGITDRILLFSSVSLHYNIPFACPAYFNAGSKQRNKSFTRESFVCAPLDNIMLTISRFPPGAILYPRHAALLFTSWDNLRQSARRKMWPLRNMLEALL